MTDGGENYSKDYSAGKVKEMIKHQEEKYNWSFIYMGSDLTDANDANSLGFINKLYSSKDNYMENYDTINTVLACYRCDTNSSFSFKSDVLNETLHATAEETTKKYAAEKGLDAADLL
jgi:Fe-S oxidoreductase